MRRLFLAALLVLLAGCAVQGQPGAGAAPAASSAAKAAPASSTPAAATSTTSATAKPTTTGATLTFEASGSGKAITIDYGPTQSGSNERELSPALPFTKQVPDTGADLYQIVIVGGENVGCRIKRDGVVVAEEPAGGSAHCIFKR